ncbi:MAG: sigma-70 family RNA polymerase sigma factor [Clostridiales bacterium]|nr:sigma-70 family RNA polymerase sigma factor [Clostridiales bacterium]
MSVVKGPDSERDDMLRQMIGEHQRALLRMCYLYLHDVQLAEDAVQETFIKAMRALDSFRGEASAKTWLTRIAMRTCMGMRRSSWFRRVDRRVTPEMLPEKSQEAEAEESALTLAVMNLPRKEREVVLLYYYQDMTMKEIAGTLGVTQPTVTYRLRRARERLRLEMEGGTP